MPRTGADDVADAPSSASLLLLSLSSRTCLCRSLLSLSLFFLSLLLFFAIVDGDVVAAAADDEDDDDDDVAVAAANGKLLNEYLSGKDEREEGEHEMKAK